MAQRRRYDDKFRASAVVMLEAAGYPGKEGALSQVANHLKIPHPTLHRWANEKNNPPPSELVQEKRGELVDWIKEELDGIFKALPGKRGEATYRDLVTGAGILTDKLQLLTGAPTENNKHEIKVVYENQRINSTSEEASPETG